MNRTYHSISLKRKTNKYMAHKLAFLESIDTSGDQSPKSDVMRATGHFKKAKEHHIYLTDLGTLSKPCKISKNKNNYQGANDVRDNMQRVDLESSAIVNLSIDFKRKFREFPILSDNVFQKTFKNSKILRNNRYHIDRE